MTWEANDREWDADEARLHGCGRDGACITIPLPTNPLQRAQIAQAIVGDDMVVLNRDRAWIPDRGVGDMATFEVPDRPTWWWSRLRLRVPKPIRVAYYAVASAGLIAWLFGWWTP